MRKVKFGVLGTAGICERALPGMMAANNIIRWAIAGRNPEKAETFRAKYGFEKAYASYMDLLEDENIEAVYIPLPNTLHFEWAVKAMEHGKHVICEKPMTSSAEKTQELFKTAKKNGVILMEAFAYQHSPYIEALDKEVQSGTIGDVRYIECAYITSDYDVSNIRMRKETCGGCTYDLGVYCNSLIYRILKREPSKVMANASFSNQGVDYLTNVLLEYDNGIRATFTSGMILATEQDQSIARFEIAGTKGSLISGLFDFNISGKPSYIIKNLAGSRKEVMIDTPQNYGLEFIQMARCVSEGATPAVSEDFSMAVARTTDQILKEIHY